MQKELVVSETFERKKNHLAWGSLVAIIASLAFDGTPIKILGVDSTVPAKPALIIAALFLLYLVVSFWLESRRVRRANSEFSAGKNVDDLVVEMQERLKSANSYLGRLNDFDFGPVPSAGLGPVVEDFKNRSHTYLDYLRSLPAYQAGTELVDDVINSKTEEAIHIQNLIHIQDEYVRRLSEFPCATADPAIAAAQGQERMTLAIGDFRSELNLQISRLAESMTVLKRDLLAEGRLQWNLVEIGPPLTVAILSILLTLGVIFFPDESLGLRRDLFSNGPQVQRASNIRDSASATGQGEGVNSTARSHLP